MNNKTTSGKCHTLVTSLFAKLKRFPLFLVQQNISRKCPWKLIAYVISQKQSANQYKELWKDVFMSKQVSLPKNSLILQKMKIGPKHDIRPFCMKAFN